MSQSSIPGFRIAGVSTCVPPTVADNLAPDSGFDPVEVRKVVAMAGIRQRRVVADGVTSGDLCFEAARTLMERLGWAPETVTAMILVTQSPDYFLPSTSSVVHRWLGLSTDCATFDVGLGCSSYPYGLYIAASMLRAGGHRRVLLLNGDTPSRFVSRDDHATALLFGDAGSATALEPVESGGGGHFVLHTDGQGYESIVMRGGGFRDRFPADPRDLAVTMDGAGVFNFTIKRVPPLIADALALAKLQVGDVDAFVFHQSNRFIIKHLTKKCGLPEDRVPMTLEDTANCGGPSVPVTLARRVEAPAEGERTVMLLGYGVGLSWGAAVVKIDAATVLMHADYTGRHPRA